MDSRKMNPYAHSLAYRNAPDTFRTTYGTSYKKVSTLEASPAYEEFRDRDFENYSYFPRDLSPYPMTRDLSPFRNKKPYQPTTYEASGDYEAQREAAYRSRFEDATLRRDEYQEPPPPRPAENEREFDTPRGRQRERGRPNGDMTQRSRAEQMLSQYDDLVADGHHNPDEIKLAVCNKCFKSNACMNRLGCAHQFCDECMARMPGSDGPFRDAVRWYFSCSLCNKRTSEAKLIRTDPYGRRLMRFHDVGYFKTS